MKHICAFIKKRRARCGADILVLLIVFAIPYFSTLGRYPLADPDEGRYAEVPREMIESGDFITPRLNYVKYFEKPPLYYWMTAGSLSAFGESEFAVRLPGVVSGLLGILLVYHIGRKAFGRREGMLAALVLGTSGGYFALSRLATIDPVLTLFMTAALGFFLCASREDERRRGMYYYLFYVSAALAVLAKGLIGVVLPGAVIFLYMLVGRRWGLLKEMRLFTGVPLFLLVCAPWFIIVSIKNPEFARFFFIHEHVKRFFNPEHREAVWYFIPVFIGIMFPWSFFLPAAVSVFRDRTRSRDADARLYTVLWAGVIFVFFSLSASKLAGYILPVLPAAALLLGAAFPAAIEGGFRTIRRQAYTVSIVFLTCGTAAILCSFPPLTRHIRYIRDLGSPALAALGALVVIWGVIAIRYALRRSGANFIVSLFLFVFLAELLAGAILPGIFISGRSSKGTALTVREKLTPETVLANYFYSPSLTFYTHRRQALVNRRKELAFGSREEDTSAWFLDIPALAGMWDSGTPLIVLLEDDDLELLRQRLKSPVTVIGRSGKVIVITNR